MAGIKPMKIKKLKIMQKKPKLEPEKKLSSEIKWYDEKAPHSAFLSQKMPGVIKLRSALNSSSLSTMKKLLYWELLKSRSIIEKRGIEFNEAMNAIKKLEAYTTGNRLTDKQIGTIIKELYGSDSTKRKLLAKFNVI